jgi:tetratricopeptide (TPR) repeat protein
MVWHLFKPATYAHRGSGTFAYPNHLAGFLTLLLPLAITFTLAGRLNYPTRIITGYAALIMLGGIAVTLSRGGWLAAFVALVLLAAALFAMRQYRIPVLVILVIIFLGGIWFYGQAQEKIKRRVAAAFDRGHDRDPRWRLWEAGIQLWQDSPWWGHGPAHFDLVYPKYRQPVNHTQLRPNFALNEYVNTLVDYGAAGVGILTLAVALGLGGGWRAWRALSHSIHQEELRGGKRAFLMGAGIGWIGLLLACVTDFHFHLPAIAMTAFALLALMCGHLRFATERYLHRAWEAQPLSHWVAHQIGEYHRRKSWRQEGDYIKQARAAMEWFRRAIELNPLDSYALVRMGMCHDWLGEHDLAEPYFLRALELDPNNYYTLANMGWHYFQRRQYRRSKIWFAASIRLNWWDNPTAYAYYRAAERLWHEKP